MVNSFRQLTLTSAIAIALVGAGIQVSTAQAATLQASPLAVAGQARVDGVYIITFIESGLLRYSGSVNGIAGTSPSATGNDKLDVHSAAAQAYQSYLSAQRAAHVSDIEFALGRNLAVTHNYAITQNAVAASMTAGEANRVAAMPGVKSIRAAGSEHIDTYRGPKFIGADTIWDGTNTASGDGTLGEGVTIGVLDTGANSAHPSFANDTSCGFRPSKPKLIAVDCSVTDANGFCAGPNPEAAPGNGHGPHTASTAGGNTIDNTANPPPLLPDGISMSGVAPCAAIISYKVCQTNTCAGEDLQAGIENAIADGVDVINYSISGGTSPWNDLDRQFLDAVDANVFIAASAGNTRAETPSPIGNVNHLGPWVLTVAASTQDQLIGPELSVTGPSPLPPPPPDLAHISLNPGSTTVVSNTMNFITGSIVSYPPNITGCTATGAFPSGLFAGRIALVQRGACSFVEKITNAYVAGAYMVVIANNQAGTINMDTTAAPPVPAFSISQVDGDALLAYVAANNPPVPPVDQIFRNGFEALDGTTAAYARAIQSSRQGDVLAGFSFRGPTPPLYNGETKPDITGPGVDIFAALTPEEGNYGLLSGTSMSSPHLAGSAALVRAVHPTWSVSEVKSAIMMTATNANGVKEDTVTPWEIDDVGSGRVDLTKAALAALTMDETFANYLAADPENGGDLRTLNLPALRDMNCDPTCSWTRTVTNRSDVSTTWVVSSSTDPSFGIAASPANFTIAPGSTQAITFTATPGATLSTIKFGMVTLAQAVPANINGGPSPLFPDQHITVAVKSPPAPPVPGVCDGGVCNLQIDELAGSFTSLGCGAADPCQFLWLNQFTPDPAEYPITLNTVQTIFGGATSTTVGDVFDVYIFQDNDNDPSNGATLVSSILNQTITAQLAFQSITIPGGLVMNGPGDILIGFVNRTLNAFPAAADTGIAFKGHSFISGDLEPVSSPPVLANLNMVPTTDVLPSFTHNWIIRAQGTNAGGAPVSLSPSVK